MFRVTCLKLYYSTYIVSTVKNKSGYTFADRLRELMGVKDVKQVLLAEKTRVTQPAVSGWLNGAMPDADQLVKISDALNVSIDYLLKGLPGIKHPEVEPSASGLSGKLLEELFADAIEIGKRAHALESKLKKLKPVSSGEIAASGAARIFDAAKETVGAKPSPPSPADRPSAASGQSPEPTPPPGRRPKKQSH
jgi:transcriptional regulator with XRE-family HTH domain